MKTLLIALYFYNCFFISVDQIINEVDAIKVQSDKNKAQSEANKALSMANKVQSDANKVQSDANKAQSEANKALSMENSNKLSVIDSKVILNPDEGVAQYDVKTGKWGNGISTVTIGNIPSDAKFILVDVFLNDAKNDHWTITFSADQTNCKVAFNFPPNGGPPQSDLSGRTQTVSLVYDAPNDKGSAWPMYGQWE